MQVRRGGCGWVRSGMAALARLGFFGAGMVLTGRGLVAPASAQISVSSGGSPSYGVNIAAPAGIAGIAPNSGLAYTRY